MDFHQIGDGALFKDWTWRKDLFRSGCCAGLFFFLAGDRRNRFFPMLLAAQKGMEGGHDQDSLNVWSRKEELVGGWEAPLVFWLDVM